VAERAFAATGRRRSAHGQMTRRRLRTARKTTRKRPKRPGDRNRPRSSAAPPSGARRISRARAADRRSRPSRAAELSSWPGLSQPSTSSRKGGAVKTWMPATSAGMTAWWWLDSIELKQRSLPIVALRFWRLLRCRFRCGRSADAAAGSSRSGESVGDTIDRGRNFVGVEKFSGAGASSAAATCASTVRQSSHMS